MTQSISLTTRCWCENSSMILKKKGTDYQCQVKSEQCFAAESAERVAIFQANLKLVREKARTQLSN